MALLLRSCFSSALFCALCGFCLYSSAARAELRAGAARVDITPDVKANHIPLGGYAARRGAPSTGVHDPVYARALVLSDGTTKVGIVSVELCFLPANIQSDVLARLKAAGVEGFDGAHLFLAATHTHCAPDPLAMHAGNRFKAPGWTSYDPALRSFTTQKIADAVIAAGRNLAPAQIGSAATELPGLNRNRRHDPIVDRALTVVKVIGADGRAIADIVNFASHPTLYGDDMRQISADWPGVMENDIEKQMGDGGVCLFLNGAEGDASPDGVDNVKSDDEKVTTYGHTLAGAALTLLATAAPKADVPLSAWAQTVALPQRKPSLQFIIASGQLGLKTDQAESLVHDLMPTTTRISFVRVGDLLLMGFPCEPSGELGLKAKEEARKAGFSRPAVVALVNDWLAYALMPEQYKENKLDTSSIMSFYGNQFGPMLLTALQTGLSTAPAKTSGLLINPARSLFLTRMASASEGRPVKAGVVYCRVGCSQANTLAHTDEPFKDVPKNHWAYEAVTKLKRMGILVGYPTDPEPAVEVKKANQAHSGRKRK